MKYAFIVLIAIYLVTYGCSPDKSEEAPASHETVAAPADQHEPAAVHQEPAPPTDAQQHQTAAAEQAPEAQAVDSEQVVMPCGRAMAKADVPENAPCLQMQEQNALITPENGEELSAAMQRMVETTNGVMVATRQLVTATYEMLNAGKGVAEEIVEEGKEIYVDKRAKQTADQSAADQGPEAAPEKEVVESMQQFISTAREVIDATNRAIYSVLEEKQQ